MFNIGLEVLDKKDNNLINWSFEQLTNLSNDLIKYFDTIGNLIIIKESLTKYGKTEQLKDLVYKSLENANIEFSLEGISDAIKNAMSTISFKIKELDASMESLSKEMSNEFMTAIKDLIKTFNKAKSLKKEHEVVTISTVTKQTVQTRQLEQLVGTELRKATRDEWYKVDLLLLLDQISDAAMKKNQTDKIINFYNYLRNISLINTNIFENGFDEFKSNLDKINKELELEEDKYIIEELKNVRKKFKTGVEVTKVALTVANGVNKKIIMSINNLTKAINSVI